MSVPISIPFTSAKYRLGVPISLVGIVLVLALTLFTIWLRSPYTHANLVPYYDSSYTRTPQTKVGPPLLYNPPPPYVQQSETTPEMVRGLLGETTQSSASVQQSATTPIEQRGEAIFVERGCAGCHTITGQGGPVGPHIVPDIKVVSQMVRQGPGGMPAFSPQTVTDYDITAIVAYLKTVDK